MSGHGPKDQWPAWVKVGVLGSTSRTMMWFWTVASLIFGGAIVVFGLLQNEMTLVVLGAIGGLGAAGMYWLTIRWVDRNGSWDEIR
jgi:hypothetical protein